MVADMAHIYAISRSSLNADQQLKQSIEIWLLLKMADKTQLELNKHKICAKVRKIIQRQDFQFKKVNQNLKVSI